MHLLSAVVLFTLSIFPCSAVKNLSLIIDDIPFKSCKMGEEIDFEELFDMSNIQYTRRDDDILAWNGTFKVKPLAADKLIPISFKSQRLVGGIWKDDLLNVRHDDVCTLLITPDMIHSEIFENMEPRTCPFKSDVTYVVKPSLLKGTLDTTFSKLNGVYKFTAKLEPIEKKFACISFQGEI